MDKVTQKCRILNISSKGHQYNKQFCSNLVVIGGNKTQLKQIIKISLHKYLQDVLG